MTWAFIVIVVSLLLSSSASSPVNGRPAATECLAGSPFLFDCYMTVALPSCYCWRPYMLVGAIACSCSPLCVVSVVPP